MKLFTKIFLCSILAVTVSLAVIGYVMISGSFRNSLERESTNTENGYQLLKFALQSAMLSEADSGGLTDETLSSAAERTASAVAPSDRAAVLGEDGGIIYSSFLKDYSFGDPERINVDDIISMTEEQGGEYRYTVSGRFTQSGRTVTLVYSRNITSVFQEKHLIEKRFFTSYLITETASALVMAALSFFLTRPIIRLTGSTRKFTGGKLDERAKVSGGGELAELSKSFNVMASTVEQNIKSLELSAKQKDDFTASFAHELKTPLTSVIGYADMIYQRSELTREEIRDAAGYIMNEGMRLEALSLKLMELIVLQKHDFDLIEMEAGEVLGDIAETVKPLLEKKSAELETEAESAYVKVEYDLFKTLMMNLIDNAAKADAKHISVAGRMENGRYSVRVRDDGRGIPEDQLERITEAFYMVDKSRSRREHGAGLGLAIASGIAEIHGTKLEFRSKPGEGTEVSFSLETAEEGEEA